MVFCELFGVAVFNLDYGEFILTWELNILYLVWEFISNNYLEKFVDFAFLLLSSLGS